METATKQKNKNSEGGWEPPSNVLKLASATLRVAPSSRHAVAAGQRLDSPGRPRGLRETKTWVGAPLIFAYFNGDWIVHCGYGFEPKSVGFEKKENKPIGRLRHSSICRH